MANGEDAPFRFPQVASMLDERFEEIFEEYERLLTDAGSLLVVGGGNTREQLHSNARSVLTRSARVMRGEEQSLLAVEEEIYRNIEATEEPLNPHPDESLRAGVALCKAAVSVVVRNLPTGSLSPEDVAEISLTVQDIVMDRVTRLVMASYVDYLLIKVDETRAEERRRFSRELHDRLAHQMVSVTQLLDLHDALREGDPARAAERLRQARETVEATIDLMRELSADLRLSDASEGLRLALDNLMSISVPSDVEYFVGFTGEEVHLPDFVRDQLYMVLREGVRNALEHSGSQGISVEVSVAPDRVTATVVDAGSGFEPDDALEGEGVGLRSMRERVELLGGSFDLTTTRSGTEIRVRLPLQQSDDRP